MTEAKAWDLGWFDGLKGWPVKPRRIERWLIPAYRLGLVAGLNKRKSK